MIFFLLGGLVSASPISRVHSVVFFGETLIGYIGFKFQSDEHSKMYLYWEYVIIKNCGYGYVSIRT
jgi:hypothetical protein